MTDQVSIRFYEELNDFLPPDRHKVTFTHKIKERGSIKDLIESLGVPHTEVDLILVNGTSVGFDYLVKANDQISVYPVFEALDITPLVRLRPVPLRVTRFVLDSHLGKLAAYLRMLGFDTLYRNDYDDATLANISANEKRILLTCDRRLLMRKIITHGYFVRARLPHEQIAEVLQRFDLFNALKPFTRCLHCNGLLQPVEKQAIESRLLPLTRAYYNNFAECPDCHKIYWQGSHYQRMLDFIETVKSAR
jgi:uncharacterized protein with PIN domain